MKSDIQFLLGFLGLVTIYVALVSYGYITAYYSGYLAEFGVSINDISFWPSLYDFLSKAFPVLVALVILTGVSVVINSVVSRVIQRIVEFGERTEKSWVVALFKDGIMSSKYIISIALLTLIIISFKFVINDASIRGAEDAANAHIFVAIGGDNKMTTDVLIYQNNNTGVIKTYDNEHRKFLSGYKIINIEGYEFRTVQHIE